MSLALSIHPLSDDLHMYGELDSSSAYSLSGHISISVSSPYSIFEARRTARLLLQSVTLTFEGQSEIFTPSTGYSSLRLCSITRQLAPSTPIELSNEGHEDANEPCVWNVIFNIPIPGWLPPTTILGMEEIGTRYALYATAKFTNIEEEEGSSSWSFASLCAPFRSRVRSSEAQRSITISRFISAPTAEITEPATLNYLVNSTSTSSSKDGQDKERIPQDVLSKIQVLASVPAYIDVNDSLLPLTLRLRTKDLGEEECKKLQVTEVTIDIIQQEKCRYLPTLLRVPLTLPTPTQGHAAPNRPLRDPHPISSIYDVGLYVSSSNSESVCRTFSLLPAEESGQYKLAADNYVFSGDAVPGGTQSWYTMDTTVPFVRRTASGSWGKYDSEEVEHEGLQWAGAKALRPSGNSPLYSALHELAVSLTCTYDSEGQGGRVAKEKLSFKVPVTFARVAPRAAAVARAIAASTESATALVNLPVYSQLYDSNGERRIDYSTPLPLYTPRSYATTSSSTPLVDVSVSDSVATASTNTNTNVNVYHDVNGIDGDAEKRHTPVVVQDVAMNPHQREASTESTL
ncbi:hypothetical protein BDZ97DRAFT_1918456 [Flammula alnicola]|nr:hypothetical protein BDZ97DRAFT_1918456 [Flammula alnicola]